MGTNSAKLGYYSAIVAFIAAVGYCVAQVLQVLGYLVFPWDAILIYGFSLCIAPPFMLTILALNYTAMPASRKVWSHAALLFAAMYATFAIFVYAVQLGVAIPKTVRGEADAINVIILTQHSFFWTLDAVAYITMGLSTLFGAFVFTGYRSHRWLKSFLLANAFITPVVALVYFYPHFSIALLMLAFPWCITAPGSILLLAIYFKRKNDNTISNLINESEELLEKYEL
jgi:hypothetical protein